MTNDFAKGYDAMVEEIKGMGWITARDKFNSENPNDQKFSSMGAYEYTKGGLQALVDSK